MQWVFAIVGLSVLALGLFAIAVVKAQARFKIAAKKRQHERDLARRLALEAEARRQHDIAQQDLRSTIEVSCDRARAIFSEILGTLLAAERRLDEAEQEFADAAFSPFWQAIERVVHQLAEVRTSLQSMRKLAHDHLNASRDFEGRVEQFPLDFASATRLEAADRTQQRMLTIVRQGQKNFQFATIFEQRRTTQVLIDGFANLGDAINGLGAQLSSSIDGLADQVRELEEGQRGRHSEMILSLGEISDQVRTVGESQHKLFERAAEAASTQRSEIAAAQAKVNEEQLAMLDNIQRSRSPAEWERGPRRF